MKYHAKINDKDYLLDVIEADGKLEVNYNGRKIKFENYRRSAGSLSMVLQDNHPYLFQLTNSKSMYDCWLDSRLTQCNVVSEKEARYAKLMGAKLGEGKSDSLKAPMPGLVVKILIENGQDIKKGEGLMIVEAMKMENELKAPSDVKIKNIKVSEGDAVDKNQILIEFA